MFRGSPPDWPPTCAYGHPMASQIAIGSAPAGEGLGGATSVALYDVADKTMPDQTTEW